MRKQIHAKTLDRRRFLTGAGLAALSEFGSVRAQTAEPSPTPTPIRIQTPDLAFTDALRTALAAWSPAQGADDLWLSIVPAEPASDQLLTDVRSGARRFSGALIPSWLMSDLVRDEFILPASAPATPLPSSVAQLRSFGGEWFATDLDHDCDLLYARLDLLEESGLQPAGTWPELLGQSKARRDRGLGGIALPVNHTQQVVDHFAAMAGAFVLGPNPTASFWFDAESMTPAIASDGHLQALELWRSLSQTMPDELRAGSTGDLWQAFIDGRVSYLVASSDFVPFALGRGFDPDLAGIAQLPGVTAADGSIVRVGNVCGASWGGVTMSSTGDRAEAEVTTFLTSLAGADVQRTLWSDRATGITPAPATQADVDATSAALTNAGWPAGPSAGWLTALYETLSNPLQLPALRIAETRRYLQALEDRIVPFLASTDDSGAETLKAAAADWTTIDDAIGIDTQQDLYRRSLMSPP